MLMTADDLQQLMLLMLARLGLVGEGVVANDTSAHDVAWFLACDGKRDKRCP